MILQLAAMLLRLLAFLEIVLDNIIPERRRQRKRQQTRKAFYNGQLWRRPRAEVNPSSASNSTSSSVDDLPASSSKSVSLANVVTVLAFILALLWIFGIHVIPTDSVATTPVPN